MRVLCCILAITVSFWASALKAQSENVQSAVDTIYLLCVGGGERLSMSIEGDGNLDLKKHDLAGGVTGQIKLERAQARGLVEGLNKAIDKTTADQANKIRDCIAPYRSRIMDLLLTPSKQEAPAKSIYENLFVNEQLSQERLRQDLGPPVSSQQYLFTNTVGNKHAGKPVTITTNLYENEDLIAYIGFSGQQTLFVAALFKRYPPNLAAELMARQIKLTDQSLGEFRNRFSSNSVFVLDLNTARRHNRLLQSGVLNQLNQWPDIAAKFKEGPSDPGSPGEIVGALGVQLFGEGQAILYYFPDAPLCDKNVAFLIPWDFRDKFSALTCEKPSAKGHLLALSRIHRYYSEMVGGNFDLNVLGDAAFAAGFFERRNLVQQPH